MATRDFRRLQVWSRAHEFVLSAYRASGGFPSQETYGLTSQLRRAAASIAMNIAEGCGRDSSADFGRFLGIATGSASEVEYQLLLARDLGYLNPDQYEKLHAEIVEVRRMLIGYRAKVTQ